MALVFLSFTKYVVLHRLILYVEPTLNYWSWSIIYIYISIYAYIYIYIYTYLSILLDSFWTPSPSVLPALG